MDWNFHIVGVSQKGYDSFQFIYSDHSQTQAPANHVPYNGEWHEFYVPKGAIVRKVTLLVDNRDKQCVKIQFFDKKDKMILEAGGLDPNDLDEDNVKYDQQKAAHDAQGGGRLVRYFTYAVEQTFWLKEGERLVGVVSCGNGIKKAHHYDLQFIIGTMDEVLN